MISGVILNLVLAFQLSSTDSLSEYEKAKERDRQYKLAILNNAHTEFILKFNRYMEKYKNGEFAVKELKAAIEAWEKLNKTEGFITDAKSSTK